MLALALFLNLSTAAIEQELSFDCGKLPAEQTIHWSAADKPNTTVTVEDGALHIVDEGTANGELQFISFPWSAAADAPHEIVAEIQVLRCTGPAGVVMLAADGEREAALTLYPDQLQLHRLDWIAPVKLDDRPHLVSLSIQGSHLEVAVDGKLLLQRDDFDYPAYHSRNTMGFGSLSSPATGEAIWHALRWRNQFPDVAVDPDAEHFTVCREPDVYACFPSLYAMPDGTLYSTFGTRSKRSHIDNSGGTGCAKSTDGGQTWTMLSERPQLWRPDMVRADGNLALAGATGWRYVDEDRRGAFEAQGLEVRGVRPGTVAYASGCWSAVRGKDGTELSRADIPMPTHQLIMGYNQSSYVNCGDGLRLQAVYGVMPDGTRHAFALRTTDDGDHWTCVTLAAGTKEVGFGEPALGLNADGDIIALLRTNETPQDRGYLYESLSTDGGATWSPPTNTGLWGYPANLLLLPDGRLLATYGYRRAPMGIRAALSEDGGRTWDQAHEIILRADGFGSGSDLGYPITTRLADGTLLTIYYFNARENVTHIACTRWTPPAKGALR